MMAVKLDESMAKLPEEQRQAINERAAELIAEEATLRQLREARERSQEFETLDTESRSQGQSTGGRTSGST
jgi:hypothetical protein